LGIEEEEGREVRGHASQMKVFPSTSKRFSAYLHRRPLLT
jgi:hypothetical protein